MARVNRHDYRAPANAAAFRMRNTSKGEQMNDEPSTVLEQAREIIAGLSESERATLRGELERMASTSGAADNNECESGEGTWDYQRQPYGRGWIQRERKVRPRKDGSQKVYIYWSFHWIEGGKRRSEHIGSDEKLQQWKEANPGGVREGS